MAVSRARMQDLIKLQCKIYNHSYNPTNIRTGAKVLRERLVGPALAAWYPRRVFNGKELEYMYFPDHNIEVLDEKESDRWDFIALRRARGKGNTTKKRTPPEAKKGGKKK